MMKIRKKLIVSLLVGLCLGLSSCFDVVVKLDRKEKNLPQSGDGSAAASQTEVLSVSSFEGYLYHLDGLKNIAPDDLVKRYKDNLRFVFRREFRNLREVMIGLAERPHNYQDEMLADLSTDDCQPLQEQDFSDFVIDEHLSEILEASFLLNLDKLSSEKISPSLPQELDTIIHIILFEFGMRASGSSEVLVHEDQTEYKASLAWSIDPEVQDDPQQTMHDDYTMQLGYRRLYKLGVPLGFGLSIDLVSDKEGRDKYSLVLDNEWSHSSASQRYFSSVMQVSKNGVLQYSRKIELEQSFVLSPVYIFRDTTRYGLDNETKRSAVLDMEKLEKCTMDRISLNMPSVIGMPPDQARDLLEKMGFVIAEVIDRRDPTDSDGEAVVIRQDPQPGKKVPVESEVRLVLGQWEPWDEVPVEEDKLPEGSEELIPGN